ncbi:Hypothetical predicted protein [Mytilus galloprovincialis]|uniref:Uncharacterized protein n=1 Tax=Mytilus galloprovincialis TaxID=29158 RepID=A0A8B6EKZ6_MYTGA|nr:Hypothetical predicted protein [Mytilus galloprovincialis]VDI36443.1 Hypothetical predicted protein [Mytilus galloprovincialis]
MQMYDIGGKCDVSDLTWEQKEKVLRYLFARMNGSAKPPNLPKASPLPAIDRSQQLSITGGQMPDESKDETFLTQTRMEEAEPVGS